KGGLGTLSRARARGVDPPRSAIMPSSLTRSWRRRRRVTEELRFVTLRGGERVPALGQGTWHMGEDRRRAIEEAAAARLGIAPGMPMMGTAEMYGGGGAEEVVARAAEGLRDRLFIVSKVYPHNASRTGVVAACERSLKRLDTDRIDL